MSATQIKLTQFSKGGGCGCKIAPFVLQQILQTQNIIRFDDLLVGNESSDDAAVYRMNDQTSVISTADFFLPIVDDPYDFGRIASANAISDIYAMGGQPMMAIAILGWPIEKLPVETAQQVLEGARSICREANIPLAGGHTIDSIDPIFGLAVTGTIETKYLKKNSGGHAGDQIFLTKPIGVGILSTALKRGVLKDEHYQSMIEQMTALNNLGSVAGKLEGVHAMTDVTGFGLLGHLVEMAEGSGLSAEIHYNSVKKIEGLDEYLQQRIFPDATPRNWNSYSSKVQFEKGVNVMEAFNVLPDPQTNGGLLIAVSESFIDDFKTVLTSNGFNDFTTPIGRLIPKKEKTIIVS